MAQHNEAGQRAEAVAAAYISSAGYKVVAVNWRCPQAEIDIIARKDQTITCFEVKYRRNAYQGNGLAYITPQKIQQMSKAARLWRHAQQWRGELTLGAVEVSGAHFEVSAFIADLL